MNNKKRDTQCLNCKHSYRGKDTILHCHKHGITSVTIYNCMSYQVFIHDKEDLTEVYNSLKLCRTKTRKMEEK